MIYETRVLGIELIIYTNIINTCILKIMKISHFPLCLEFVLNSVLGVKKLMISY